jgi:nicotinamide-nucleotide amidase
MLMKNHLTAEIIAIGSELLTPNRSDTNSLWLTERLNSVGIDVKLKTIVGDDESRLEETIRDAVKRSNIIVATGGLGPTEDDITRKVFARVLGRPLVLNEAVLTGLRNWFASRGYKMAPNNERQALVPQGAEVLANPNGTAPGLMIREDSKYLFILPGPPREMKPMFDNFAMPLLSEASQGIRIHKRLLKTTGLGESAVDDMIAPIYTKYENPTTTILFTPGEIEIHLTATADSDQKAEALLDELSLKIEEKMDKYLFSADGKSMEEVVAVRLKLKGYTIATAESCTGGLLAKRLTDVPGSSDYFLSGVVSYANDAKVDLVGVAPQLIEKYGAVSAEVAEAMAIGIKHRAGTNLGVGITGVAGPGGGSAEKPVGLVYIALADDAQVEHKRWLFPGDRERVRYYSSEAALDMIRRRIVA